MTAEKLKLWQELIAKWRCYVCGEPIGDSFILFSLNVETDRVFLAHKKCQARLDSEAILFGVQREVAALAASEPKLDSREISPDNHALNECLAKAKAAPPTVQLSAKQIQEIMDLCREPIGSTPCTNPSCDFEHDEWGFNTGRMVDKLNAFLRSQSAETKPDSSATQRKEGSDAT